MNNFCGSDLSFIIKTKDELEKIIKSNYNGLNNATSKEQAKAASLMLKFNRKSCIDTKSSEYGKYLKELDMDGYHFGIKNSKKINISSVIKKLNSFNSCYLFEDKTCKIISYR